MLSYCLWAPVHATGAVQDQSSQMQTADVVFGARNASLIIAQIRCHDLYADLADSQQHEVHASVSGS